MFLNSNLDKLGQSQLKLVFIMEGALQV